MGIKDKVFMNKELFGKFEKNEPGVICNTWGDSFEVVEISTGYLYKCLKEEININPIL